MKRIINQGTPYYVVSLKHTNKKDKFFTLWRPANAGYCWPLSLAGMYDGYEDHYHRTTDQDNVPIKVEDLPRKFIVLDDQQRECIKVSREAIQFIKQYKP